MSQTQTERGQGTLKLTNLHKAYGSLDAVRDVNLDIKEGEFLTLLGPSGSGKTTTLMMIAGFVTPTAGDITLGGESIVLTPPHKRNIGMVFQHYALFPHMTIRQNIAFPLEMRRMGRAEIEERVKWALDLVQLPHVADRKPKQLSGGQQQRIALARALVFEPPLLLLDEPLGALDRKLREGMQFELRRIHHSLGTTIIYVTHDQDEALTMSDRIAVFNEGHIVQVDSPADMYITPKSRFVAGFLGESNFFEGRVIAQESERCTVELDDGLQLTAALSEPLKPGTTRVTLSLRPENCQYQPTEAQTPNRFRGRIEEMLYLGVVAKYRIRLGDSTTMIARWSRDVHQGSLEIGDEVEMGLLVQDLLVVEQS